MLKIDNFLYDDHWGSPTLTVLKELDVLNVLNMLKMTKDPSLSCWAVLFMNHAQRPMMHPNALDGNDRIGLMKLFLASLTKV